VGRASRKISSFWVGPEQVKGRKTVQQLAKGADADRTTRILTALRLWDVRKSPVAALGESHRRIAAFIPALASRSDLIVAEDWIDLTDPWTLNGLLELLREHSAAKVIASNRPDVLLQVDRLLVLNHRGLRFDGAPSDLLKIVRPAIVKVETENPGAVAALIEPLQLQIESSPGSLLIRTAEGQHLAADLILRGYPWVNAVAVRTPTLDEALRELTQ
jgi:ABC-type multidrug transport system ATPase subunit